MGFPLVKAWATGETRRLGLFQQASPPCPPISSPQTAQIHPGRDPDEGALSHGPCASISLGMGSLQLWG